MSRWTPELQIMERNPSFSNSNVFFNSILSDFSYFVLFLFFLFSGFGFPLLSLPLIYYLPFTFFSSTFFLFLLTFISCFCCSSLFFLFLFVLSSDCSLSLLVFFYSLRGPPYHNFFPLSHVLSITFSNLAFFYFPLPLHLLE